MKRVMTITILLLLSASYIFAQGYKEGDVILNAGAGIGLNGIYGDSNLPPVSVGIQFGTGEKLSLGGLVGYSSSSYDFATFNQSYTWDYTYIILAARGEYHFLESSNKLDAYAGVTVGYNLVSVSEPSGYNGFYSSEGSYFLYGGHAGLRYALSNNFGVFAEAGYGVGYITGGVTFKL